MKLLDKSSSAYLYQQVIDFIEHQQKIGALHPGDKLPSLRKLSRQFDISVPTVKQAYIELERQGQVCAKPQSGYYLQAIQARTLKPRPAKWAQCDPVEVQSRSMIEQVHAAVHLPDTVALGISNPIQAHPPDKALARLMRSVLSKVSEKAVSYGPVTGDAKLRMQLAFRYQEQSVEINPDDIVITNGAQEALSIALQCVAKRGDIIAIESPCFFGIIELIESLGMRALEVYTCTEDGVCLEDLTEAINQYEITACLFSTAINNPLGSMKTDEQRQAMVSLLERHDIPLIEDEVYSEIYFSASKPKPAQLYSEKGLVMTCSSFSKTAAPGYRIGWLLPGKFEEQAKRIKRAQSASTPMLQQWTLNEYLLSGDYDRHLCVLRKTLAYNCERMRALIAEHFPPEVCISKPLGGSVLWLRCQSHVKTGEFFQQALAQGVSFAPGAIFSPSGKYQNYMRVSYGVQWGEDVETAIKVLGQLVYEYTIKQKTAQLLEEK
ncbi:aminotransferase-like domain-containing protein [Colwellia psychrerythraea]|uniref:Transcriptional regulator, GntR family with aminotransferase domain containing protein n=1 Tax=Colwellia psychrerythraea TaxID=28229 RepID=A0A099KVY0_COLPS|nr:PLP-dependent aminotransferase family protein [Colwellia psychrerythraea]KGJ94350.1 transcriptional regulator, GntR family with aminotransferase domain containing protein [Colwellia psychrerythraea]